MVIATAKSSRPKMFHSSAARRPCAVPEATASGAGSAITPNDHVADPGGPGEITRDRTVRPVDQEDAAESTVATARDRSSGGRPIISGNAIASGSRGRRGTPGASWNAPLIAASLAIAGRCRSCATSCWTARAGSTICRLRYRASTRTRFQRASRRSRYMALSNGGSTPTTLRARNMS
jgi:hypothetical protein